MRPAENRRAWMHGRPAGRKLLVLLVMAVVSAPAPGRAQQTQEQPMLDPPPHAHRPGRVRPPPINVDYVQFGVAFTGTVGLNPGPQCPQSAVAPCILGSGGGLAARAGYRSRGPWYFGGVYDFQKLTTNGLMRLGILQNLGGEARYLAQLGLRTEPYLTAGLSAAAFGNEWGFETWGFSMRVGAGFEVQLARTTIIGMSMAYRPVLLMDWTDRAGQARDTGVAHYLGFELVMEAREPLRTH